MSEFEDRLNSILNDPMQMEKITLMAKSLVGGDESAPKPQKMQPKQESSVFESFDPALLGRVTKAMSGMNGRDEKHALLEAMKPYLSSHRQEKLERAMKLAKMIHVAEIAFGTLGGDDAKI